MLRTQNFRSLRSTSIDWGLNNVLVGPNLSGKSNIVDAFRFLRDMLASTDPGILNAFTQRLGYSEVAWKGDDPKPITLDIEATFPRDGTEFDLDTPSSWRYQITLVGTPPGWARVHDEALTFDPSDRKIKIIDFREGKRFLFNEDGTQVAIVDDPSRAALEYEIPSWDGDKIRSMIRSWRFYQLIPTMMRRINPSAATTTLSEHGDNLSSWLMTLQTRHRDSFSKLLQTLRDVFPELQELSAWTTEQSTVFAVAQEKHLRRRTPISQMSDGQLCFIALASLIFAPEELGAALYCIEEPENYLHPKLMETLFALLRQRQDELGRQRSAQIVVTTHSPHVIDQFSLDELVVLGKKRGETTCTRPREKRHLRELLEREEAGLGQLYYSGSLS